MKEQKNLYSLSYTGVRYTRDIKSLVKKVEYLGGFGRVTIQVSQGGVRFDVGDLTGESLKNAGLDLRKPFSAHLTMPSPNCSFVDRTDAAPISERIDKLRGNPFFFRDNGQPVDLLGLYKGGSVFLLLNGPSMKFVNTSLLKTPGILTYGVNNGAHFTRPNFWSCVDNPSRFMQSIWADPAIQKFVPTSHFPRPVWDHQLNTTSALRVSDFPNVLGIRRNERFSADKWLDETTINWGNHGSLGGGRSVMLVALKVCYLLGFKNVYLVGCDFTMTQQNGYFFEEQRTEKAVQNNLNSYRIMGEYFAALQPRFLEAGFNVFNTYPDSGLRAFPFIGFEEAVREATASITELLSETTYGMYQDRSICKNNTNNPTTKI